MKKVTSFAEYLGDEERVNKEEREEILFQKNLIVTMAELRQSAGISQRELSSLSGVKQPVIARIESMKNSPRIDTLLKILVSLGYTLEIVPIKRET